jgi:hypothetical protein
MTDREQMRLHLPTNGTSPFHIGARRTRTRLSLPEVEREEIDVAYPLVVMIHALTGRWRSSGRSAQLGRLPDQQQTAGAGERCWSERRRGRYPSEMRVNSLTDERVRDHGDQRQTTPAARTGPHVHRQPSAGGFRMVNISGAGRGDRTPMSLRSKVFEFYADQASTVTIGHVWRIFSNLNAGTS